MSGFGGYGGYGEKCEVGGYGERCERRDSGFALIVVLFILLIIVGAVIFKDRY